MPKRKRDTDAVEKALLRRALGYRAREIYLVPADSETSDSTSGLGCGETSEKVVKITEKDVAPSIQACIAWLKAYSPEIWGKTVSADEDSDVSMLYAALTNTSNALQFNIEEND
ncbi:MAG: hypothetical protein LBM87_00300 [Ruminococcus sp.]|jgi:hypothetical protein|nr:hypothetical protein [Ruminococcus sp.]